MQCAHIGLGLVIKPERRTMRALCIDDHAINRRVLVAMLETAGIVADEAESGHSGIAMVEASNYDVIFMDLRMPIMDGVEAATSIRARHDEKSRTPIILVTADASVTLEAEAWADRFNGALFKPLKPEQLFDTIAKVLMSNGTQAVQVG
eukprot:gene18214-18466_t